MTRIDWPQFLRMITVDASGADIARSANVSEATVSRWLAGKAHPNPQQVVAVCRAFGMHPANGLEAAGYIDSADDLLDKDMPAQVRLQQFSDLELARETVRRIAAGGSSILEDPLDGDHPAMESVSPIRKDAKSPRNAETAPAVDADAPVDIVDKSPQVAAQNPPRLERVTTPRLEKVREKKPAKKAALTDPEMNTDETYD